MANIFAQDEIQLPKIEQSYVLESPELYIPISITYQAETKQAKYWLDGKAITLPTLEAESFDFIKKSEAIQKDYQRQYEEDFDISGKVNYLIRADKAVPFVHVQLLMYYIQSFPDGKTMLQTASEGDEIHAVRIYPPYLFEPTQKYIEEQYGLEIERFSFKLYDAFNEPFQLKNAEPFGSNNTDTEPVAPPPPPPPPPSDVRFMFGGDNPDAQPVVTHLTAAGITQFNGAAINTSQFDTLLNNILDEVENGTRAKNTLAGENGDSGSDVYIVLSVEKGISLEQTITTYMNISKTVGDKEMKKYVHYSYPEEADLILRAISRN